MHNFHRYQSYGLDFVSHADIKDIESCLTEHGFKRSGRCFQHSDCPYLLDFLNPPVAVGDQPVREYEQLQGLEQAVLVAKAHPVDMESIKQWAEREGYIGPYQTFVERVEAK